jgi:hypothetical protein
MSALLLSGQNAGLHPVESRFLRALRPGTRDSALKTEFGQNEIKIMWDVSKAAVGMQML